MNNNIQTIIKEAYDGNTVYLISIILYTPGCNPLNYTILLSVPFVLKESKQKYIISWKRIHEVASHARTQGLNSFGV
jgi:hypothetical protein